MNKENKNGMKTLLDVDGVVLNSHAYFLDQVNKRYALQISKTLGRPLRLEDITAWDFGAARRVSGIPVIRTGKDGPLGAVDYIHEAYLQTGYVIPLVDPSAAFVTNYLIKYFGAEIVTSNNSSEGMKRLLEGYSIDTSAFRRDEKSDTKAYFVLIEDNPTIEVGDDQIMLLRDQPWNRRLSQARNILRFDDSLQLPGIMDWINDYRRLPTAEDGRALEGASRNALSVERYGIEHLKKTYVPEAILSVP